MRRSGIEKVIPYDHNNLEESTNEVINPPSFYNNIKNSYKNIESSILQASFGLGMSDDPSYSFERYQDKLFRDKILENQTRDHNNKDRLFYWIGINALSEIKDLLSHNPDLIEDRDSAGATPIHIAYLYENYEIGHWLVEHFPLVAAQPYNADSDSNDKMPYTGETILHMVIVRRNCEEIRWILDYYKDHQYLLRDELQSLLLSNVTGKFFQKEEGFYFGGYPLHFAVCSGDPIIFDLVFCFTCDLEIDLDLLKPTSEANDKHSLRHSEADNKESNRTKHARKISSLVFIRDNYGNTCLHLCVLHCLKDMYSHVYNIALDAMEYELTIHISSYAKKTPTTPEKLKLFEFLLESASGHSVKPRSVYVPRQNRIKEWLAKHVSVKLDERLVLALNNDLHSPLTLAASQVRSSNGIVNETERQLNSKRLLMFTYLLSHMKKVLWVFGPVQCSLIDLNGVEIRYDRNDYPTISHKNSNVFSFLWNQTFGRLSGKTEKHNSMYSAIAWVCRNEAEEAVIVPEVRRIIQMKWERFGYPKFLVCLTYDVLVCILVSLVLVFNNFTPISPPTLPGESAVDVLYAILVLLFLNLFIAECRHIYSHPYSYFNVKGIVKFSRRCCWLKMTSFTVFLALKIQLSSRGLSNHYASNDDTLRFNPQNYAGIKISLTICALFSWLHLYYYLAGFDKTGLFILTIFRIVSKDVPYFLKFYSIIVVAFSCVLSMLANRGDSHAYYGFFILLEAIYSLIQNTVNTTPTHNSIDLTIIPSDVNWLADIILTFYYGVVVLIMLNLLIAMINSTYGIYTSYNESLLLMEKYNIMHSFETALSAEELKECRAKFTVIHSANDNDDEDIEFSLGDDKTRQEHLIEMRLSKEKFSFEMQADNPDWYGFNEGNELNHSQLEILAASIAKLQAQQQYTTETMIALCSKLGLAAPPMNISPGERKRKQSTVLIIDPQCDFYPADESNAFNGSFPIATVKDARRIADMIHNNYQDIRDIVVSLDSRYPHHISHSLFWIDNDFTHPSPFTQILFDDVKNRKWRPVNPNNEKWSLEYLSSLERNNRMPLTIWPEHCFPGSRGHCIIPIIDEAIQKWAHYSGRLVTYVYKTANLRTEMTSVFRAEVEDPFDSATSLNFQLINNLKVSDRVLICGTSLSHRVNVTVRDLSKRWHGDMNRIVVLSDGTSSIPIFEKHGEDFLLWAKDNKISVCKCADAF